MALKLSLPCALLCQHHLCTLEHSLDSVFNRMLGYFLPDLLQRVFPLARLAQRHLPQLEVNHRPHILNSTELSLTHLVQERQPVEVRVGALTYQQGVPHIPQVLQGVQFPPGEGAMMAAPPLLLLLPVVVKVGEHS